MGEQSALVKGGADIKDGDDPGRLRWEWRGA